MQLYFTGGNNDQANCFTASHSILEEQAFVFCIRAFTGDALAPFLFTLRSAAADAAANEKHAPLAPPRARICRRHTCVRTRREKEKKRSKVRLTENTKKNITGTKVTAARGLGMGGHVLQCSPLCTLSEMLTSSSCKHTRRVTRRIGRTIPRKTRAHAK